MSTFETKKNAELLDLLDGVQVIPGFDVLKVKEDIQAQIWNEIKDLTPEERTAYWEKVNQRARKWYDEIRAKHQQGSR